MSEPTQAASAAYVVVPMWALRAALDHTDDRWNDEHEGITARQALEAAIEVVIGGACRNCGAVLVPEPLAPDGVIHERTRDLLCPGHTTLASDGSNTAQRGRSSVEGGGQ